MAHAALSLLYLASFCVLPLVHGQDGELNILVGVWNPGRILNIGLPSGNITRLPITRIGRPYHIDYDPQTKTVYWADVSLREIRATHILGTSERVLLSLKGSAEVLGLAVDHLNRQLFYTDRGNNVIVKMNIDSGDDPMTKIETGLNDPRAIVVHEERRVFYWTDFGANTYIARADYDGSNRVTIVDSGLIWPNGLAMDKARSKLYWCDAKTSMIESYDMINSQRRTIASEPGAHYFDIFFHQDTLFFTDWKRKAVLSLPAGGGSLGVISSEEIGQLAGIHVFSNMDASACADGQFGVPCKACGNCRSNSACDKVTGICLAGCQDGYEGMRCTEAGCPSNTYSDTCQPCGRCAGAVSCDSVSGECPGGCVAGWTGSRCDKADVECPSNTYGSSCRPCGQCAENEPCDILTGICLGGCKAGWTGFRCDAVCPFATWGESCESCGNCKNSVACDRGSGACLDGCQPGWGGTRCDTPGDDKPFPVGIIAGIAGGVAFILIVIAVIVLAVVLMRRKKRAPSRRPDSTYDQIYCVPDMPPDYSTLRNIPPPMDGYSSIGTANFSTAQGFVNLGVQNEQRESGDYDLPLKE